MSSLELWPKQQEALEFALSRDEVALLCEQRTGKTFITMALMKKLCEQEEEFVGALVVLLNNKESTWIDNLSKYIPELVVFTDLVEFRKHKGHRLLLVHYEQLKGIIGKLCKYKKLNFAGVDEGHRLQNRGSAQSRAMARLKWVKRKLLLSGTPIEKEPQNMWAQFRFLAPDVLGTRWEDFEDDFMDFTKIDTRRFPVGTEGWRQDQLKQRILRSKATFREDMYEEFTKLVDPYCFRLTKASVGIKPPQVIKVTVDMTGAQARCYKELDKKSVTYLPSGKVVTAGMEVTAITKRRQLASGFVYRDDEEIEYLRTAKMSKLEALVERLSKPVVVFTAYVPDALRIHRRLSEKGYNVGLVYGKVKKKDRPDIWRAFQKAQYDILVCQIRTGGVGVDLWKANNAIVYSMGHSYIDWDQAKARLDSKDKRIPAKIFVLCSKHTIDEDLYELVMVKHLNGDKVLSQLKGRSPWPKKRLPKPLSSSTRWRTSRKKRA